MLDPYGAFVLAADLEGLLIDLLGWRELIDALGPDGLAEIDAVLAKDLLGDCETGPQRLASCCGSKGWNSDGSKSGKMKPHIPGILIESWLDENSTDNPVIQPLVSWLTSIREGASSAGL